MLPSFAPLIHSPSSYPHNAPHTSPPQIGKHTAVNSQEHQPMASTANPNGTLNSTIAGQDSGEPQLNNTDSIGILKQQLVKIAKDKHEKLIKDVEGVLQSYTSEMKSDLIYIINEYTTVKGELDELTKENMHLKAVNATLSERLISTQNTRQGSGSSSNDKAAIENLRLELDITTKELSRALDDVEKLKAQHSQMEVTIQHKDVVNHQLAAIVNNRQMDINLKQKENTGLTAQLIDTQAKLAQAMDFVGQYYPVLEPEVMKRKALHQKHQQFHQQQQQHRQQQQQLQGFPRPAAPIQMLNGPVMGHFSQGSSTSPLSPSPHHPIHISSQSMKEVTFPMHQGHPHQPLSAPPLTELLTPASSTRPVPLAQLRIVDLTMTPPPAFLSPTSRIGVSTASLLQQGKSQIEANSTQSQGQDQNFQDLKKQAAIEWWEKHQHQAQQQYHSETGAPGAPQYQSQLPVPPATQHHQHQQQLQLQQQQLQHLQRQQQNQQHQQSREQQQQSQEQPMIRQYQQQKIHRFINPRTSQDQHTGPTSSQQFPEPHHLQSWGMGPEQDPTSHSTSSMDLVLRNIVSPVEPLSHSMSNSAAPSSTPVIATIIPALLLSASPTSPADPASLPTPVLTEEARSIALKSELTSTSTKSTGPTDPTNLTESTKPAEPAKPRASTVGSTISANASLSTSPTPELVAVPIADTLMTETVAEPTTTESLTTAALPEPPSHSTRMPSSGMISQSPSEQSTRPTQGLNDNRKRSHESAILLEETEGEGEHINANADKGHDDDEGFSQPTPVDFDFDHDRASPLPLPHKPLQTSADEFKHESGKWYVSSVLIPAFSPSRSSPVADPVTLQRRQVVIEVDGDGDDDEDVFVDVDDSIRSASDRVRSSPPPSSSRVKSAVREIYHNG